MLENYTKTCPYILYVILSFCIATLFACTSVTKENPPLVPSLQLPDLAIQDAKFPLKLETLDWQDSSKIIHLNDEIEAGITTTIYDYYFQDCSGDSSQTYFTVRDVYLKTLRLQDTLQTVFLVLLKHAPESMINGKVLFYDNVSKTFIGKAVDFNIHALYHWKGGKLKPSSLKQLFEMNGPEIECLDYDKDGINEFKFTRLYHNGTANAIETAVLKVAGGRIDTLDFKQEWKLGLDEK